MQALEVPLLAAAPLAFLAAGGAGAPVRLARVLSISSI